MTDGNAPERQNRVPQSRFVIHLRGAGQHVKFKRLARRLGVSPFTAYGVTAVLWDWADTHRPLGVLDDLSDEDVVEIIGAQVTFEPSKLIAAWLESRLLDRGNDGVLSIHNWTADGRSGSFAARRSAKALQGAHARFHVRRDVVNVDCPLCVGDDASSNVTGDAADAIGGTSDDAIYATSEDARRETRDERRETRDERRETRDAKSQRRGDNSSHRVTRTRAREAVENEKSAARDENQRGGDDGRDGAWMQRPLT